MSAYLGEAAALPTALLWIMMVAVRHISTGLAQTFLALSPVLIVPFMRWIYGERVGLPAAAGALVAFLGVALLFAGR